MIDFNTMRRILVLLAVLACATSCTTSPRSTVDSIMAQLAACSGMGGTLGTVITSNTTHTVVRDLQNAKQTFAISPHDCRVMKDGLMVQQAPIAALNFVSNGTPVAVLEVIELFGKTNVQIVAWSPTTNWLASTDRQLISELLQVEPIRVHR